VVQALYDAIAAGDVERFFGARHPQFQAELPGYLPWGKDLDRRVVSSNERATGRIKGKQQDQNSAG
jgi:ketosteroid isomerase-like protein